MAMLAHWRHAISNSWRCCASWLFPGYLLLAWMLQLRAGQQHMPQHSPILLSIQYPTNASACADYRVALEDIRCLAERAVLKVLRSVRMPDLASPEEPSFRCLKSAW